ncbi:MAG: cytochrome c-type biogenesis protein CcmH [Burkholderiales bacterium]|nr:cytochrome c-type biogenesis protein CcmH [Burkholderiales bacterium]MDE2452801.1 cytochrome c-type biogenesis protein CcmH [Burkholderiales bacterium]
MARALLLLILAFAAALASAKEAAPAAANPALEARMMALASTFRCLVCQNETIADSQADLAADLRQEMREMLAKGMTDAQIRRYMTDRYGDFVLYKPPFEMRTALLWGGPPLLLVVALAALFLTLRRRLRASPDRFDPDTPEDADEPRLAR